MLVSKRQFAVAFAFVLCAGEAGAAPHEISASQTPCVIALPRVATLGRATIQSRCGSKEGIVHDGDGISLAPRGHLRLRASLEGGRSLEVTCVSATTPLSVTVAGNEAPWLDAGASATCGPWTKNERVCTSASGEELLVCAAEAHAVAASTTPERSLGVPSWYVGEIAPAVDVKVDAKVNDAKVDAKADAKVADAKLKDVVDDRAGRIALAPFEAVGVDAALASALTDVLGIELEKFEGVDIVTPVEVRAALNHEALAQIIGCEEPSCFGQAQELVPAGRLIGGRVSVVDGRTMVTAVLIDLARAEVRGRVAQPVPGGFDDVAAAMKTFALVLLDQDPVLRGSSVVVKGEVTAELLERVRVGQREKGIDGKIFLGTVLLTSLSSGDAYPRTNAGFAGRLVVDVPLTGFLNGEVVGGAQLSTGRFSQRETFIAQDDTGFPVGTARGEFAGNSRLLDVYAGAGVKLRPPVGVVLPYVSAIASADFLMLDVDDFTFNQDPDSANDVSLIFTQAVENAPSYSAGLGLRIGAGVDYLATEHLVLSLDATAFGTFHGLELISESQNVVKRSPFPPLYGFTVTVGCGFML